MTDAAALFTRLRERIVNQKVTSRLLAGNTLLLYVAERPSPGLSGLCIWLNPSWHLRDARRILTGSMQAQDGADTGEDPDCGFRRAGRTLDVLKGKTVENLFVEPVTFDLQVELEGGLVVRTFSSAPDRQEAWHIQDFDLGLTVSASPLGLIQRSERRQ